MPHASPVDRWLSGLCLVTLVVSTAGLSGCADPPESSLERIEREGFVRVGYTHEPPYAFLEPDGEVRGESPVALRGALPSLPADSIRWIRLELDELLAALDEGRVDVVASGLYPSSERSRLAAFSASTSCSSAALLIRAGNARPAGLAAFSGPETGVLAVTRGAVEEQAARRIDIPAERLLPVPDLPTGIAAVRDGLADALALTVPTLRRALSTATDTTDLDWYSYEPAPRIRELVQGCSALAVRAGDTPLLQALNRGLETFVGSDEHRRALTSLGFGDQDLPPASTGGVP